MKEMMTISNRFYSHHESSSFHRTSPPIVALYYTFCYFTSSKFHRDYDFAVHNENILENSLEDAAEDILAHHRQRQNQQVSHSHPFSGGAFPTLHTPRRVGNMIQSVPSHSYFFAKLTQLVSLGSVVGITPHERCCTSNSKHWTNALAFLRQPQSTIPCLYTGIT